MNTQFLTSTEGAPSKPTAVCPSLPALHQERTTILVTVRAASEREDMIRADGHQGEYYLLSKRVMGNLWGQVKRGDKLELVVELVPGKATKIFSVHLPAT